MEGKGPVDTNIRKVALLWAIAAGQWEDGLLC